MESNLFFLLVFAEGMASFLSPCVLPMIPTYFVYLTGQSAENMMDDRKGHRVLVVNSIAFISGFSIVFVLMGAVATSIGSFLVIRGEIIRRISGIVIIVFGLFHTGVMPIPFLNYEKKVKVTPGSPGLISSLLIGMGFSLGWTPCIGPILTSVLIMAANTGTVGMGMILLGIYSLGLGLPFILIALSLRYIWRYFKAIYKYMRIIKIISGLLLVIIGIIIYFNFFYVLAGL